MLKEKILQYFLESRYNIFVLILPHKDNVGHDINLLMTIERKKLKPIPIWFGFKIQFQNLQGGMRMFFFKRPFKLWVMFEAHIY